MRQFFSLGLISAVLFSAISPSLAQNTREVKSLTVKSSEGRNRFGTVQAFSDGDGVLVQWQMALETNNNGFEVFRLDGRRSVKVSSSLIMGSWASYGAKAVAGEKYSFFDAEGTASSVYFVRSYAMDGSVAASQTSAVDTVSDLGALGFGSSEDLHRQAESKQRGNVTSEEPRFPKLLAQEVNANKVSADSNAHAWVVAQPGVRIGVRREGLYRVTRTELQNAGFNVNADSSQWQLFREGVEQAILLGPNADYIDFFGKGVDTPETDMAVYYLVNGQSAGKRMNTKVARPFSGTFTSPNYAQVFLQKQKISYSNTILNGDAENYWGVAITTFSNSPAFNFTLTGVDFSVPQVQMELKFQGVSFTPHNVSVVLNGETLVNATGNSQNAFSANYTIPTSYLREGTNSIIFREISAGPFQSSLFDSIKIDLKRKHLAAQDRLRFYTDNYRLSKLAGFSNSSVRVFDITDETAPVLWTNLNVIPENSTFSVQMPADRGRSMYAVADPGVQTVASISVNDPAVLRSPSLAANLVIISHKNWMIQAEAWANYRRGQGFTVKVVDVDEIFDEFNYGDQNSLSIRDFLQYAKNNWQTAPGYVLLLGDASYDPRNYTGNGYNNYVPTHIVNTVFTETGSDDFLADFNGDGLADMAIGRITARTSQTVTNAFAKVTAWEGAIPTPQARGVLFAFDWFDATNNYDFEQISIRLKNQLPPTISSTMIGRDDTPPPPDTPQTVLVSAINTGKYVVNYSGHGSAGAWAHVDFFSNANVPQLNNANNLSIFTMLTCLNGWFLQPVNKSLSETLVEATNGGAVAAWASTGETTPDVQEVMATRFFLKVGQGQIARLGDLVNDAKTVIPSGTDVRLSWALIGDPMLKVFNPPAPRLKR